MPDPTSADTRPLDLEAINGELRAALALSQKSCAAGWQEVERLTEALQKLADGEVWDVYTGPLFQTPVQKFAAAALSPQPKGAQS